MFAMKPADKFLYNQQTVGETAIQGVMQAVTGISFSL